MGSLGSRKMPAAEDRSGPLLAMAGAMVGKGGAWGAPAGSLGTVEVAGSPFWAS